MRLYWGFPVIIMMVLAACSPQPTETISTPIEPTLMITETDIPEPTMTIAPPATLPPEWTKVPMGESGQPEQLPEQTEAVPVAEVTSSANSMEMVATANAEAAAMDTVCESFGPDLSLNERVYRPAQDATVYWTPVQGAKYYSIVLLDETGNTLVQDYTEATSFVFSADFFADGGLYGWEVFPVSTLGQQMCLSRGAELFPEYQ